MRGLFYLSVFFREKNKNERLRFLMNKFSTNLNFAKQNFI